MLIDHMSEGGSFDTFAAVISVNRETTYAWLHDFKEFSNAKKQGSVLRDAFTEKLYKRALIDPDGYRPQPSLLIFWAKNTMGWSDKSEVTASVTTDKYVFDLDNEVPSDNES